MRRRPFPHYQARKTSWCGFAKVYLFDTDRETYSVHIATGVRVSQSSLFLLTEARYFSATFIQMLSLAKRQRGPYQIVDLDLSRDDLIAQRSPRGSGRASR